MTTIVDTEGEPLRLAVRAEPDVVSPNELEAEELVGHEFNDIDDRARAVVEMTRLGPAEAIMTVSDGCYAHVLEGGGTRSTGSGSRNRRSARRSARATPSSPATSPPAISGRSPTECLRYGVACGAESVQHFGAGLLDPGPSTGCSPRSSSSISRSARRSAENTPELGANRVAGSSITHC